MRSIVCRKSVVSIFALIILFMSNLIFPNSILSLKGDFFYLDYNVDYSDCNGHYLSTTTIQSSEHIPGSINTDVKHSYRIFFEEEYPEVFNWGLEEKDAVELKGVLVLGEYHGNFKSGRDMEFSVDYKMDIEKAYPEQKTWYAFSAVLQGDVKLKISGMCTEQEGKNLIRKRILRDVKEHMESNIEKRKKEEDSGKRL